MLPVTQTAVRWMNVNAPSPGVSAELVRYIRSEYGENAYYARAMVGQADETRAARLSVRTDGLLRRIVAAISQTVAARASPGGA